MESEMYERSWSCIHNNQIMFIADNTFEISKRVLLIWS
jgi:hypothetical protein